MDELPAVRCPYCGEEVEVAVDPSTGSHDTIEDCAVCCRPMELSVVVDRDGAVTMKAHRDDD